MDATTVHDKIKRFGTIGIALLVLLSAQRVIAQESLTFVVGKNTGVYKKIIHLTSDKLLAASSDLHISTITTDQYSPNSKPNETIVTIGTQAAKTVYANPSTATIISGLITRSAHQALQPHPDKLTTLFLDQPYVRFLALGKKLVPTAQSVGILLGPATNKDRAYIARIAKEQGLSPIFALISPEKNPVKIIEPVIQNTDFFVVIPDRLAINQAAAKWVILLAYRHQKPIIAYSKKYATAGALASIYASPENIATALFAQILTKGIPTTNQHFSIYINPTVARSLKVPISNTETIKKSLEKYRSTP